MMLFNKLGIGLGETTPDNRFTLLPNSCLGACHKATVMIIDEQNYTRISGEQLDAILETYP